MDEGKVTTSSHRKQYMVLQRVANGPRAADFPELVKMFRGTKTEKLSALRAFVSSGENLEAVESTFASRRLQSETLSKLRRCLTIREMQQLGCSTRKIEAVVAKGGVPDADAPNDPDSMRYWVTLGMEETNVESTETSVSISGQVRNQQAMEALSSKSVAAPLVTVPDPNEMVRNQLAAAAASTAPSVGDVRMHVAQLQAVVKELKKSAWQVFGFLSSGNMSEHVCCQGLRPALSPVQVVKLFVVPLMKGLQLFGDEAQIQGTSYMALHWSSEQSPYWSKAKRSKFLIALVKERLRAASRQIVQWSRHGLKKLPKHWVLNRFRLSLTSQKFCHLTGKGWHTDVVLRFLETFLQRPDVICDDVVKTTVWSAVNVIDVLFASRRDHGLFMEEQDIQQVRAVGSIFCSSYLQCHQSYIGFCPYYMFNIRPKFHLYVHLLDSTLRRKNPLVGATWLDESWISDIMTIASKTHKKKTFSSTLQRYLAGRAQATLFFFSVFLLSSLQDSKLSWSSCCVGASVG
ncbi:unnamed protein product [Durusdinium trenchii]|uniref:Uncharacterized protein n=1 Tax=Durusdinium trenchii TaxID=1381693 RepID=A0ABP0IE60_9DINO